jgi:hypothetical protein
MDSTTVVNFLKQYMNEDLAIMVFGLLGILVPFIWRALASWAANRPTTWYWNPVTKKFVLGRASAALGKIFGRGVNDCNIRYEDNLPEEAKTELRKHVAEKYPIATDPDPNTNECPSSTENKSNGE